MVVAVWALVGSLVEAKARGVDFAGVAGTSAGSIVAALVGAGATPDVLVGALGSLDFASLLKEPEELYRGSVFHEDFCQL